MGETVSMRCPGCGGMLHIDLETRKMVCSVSGYKTDYWTIGKNVRRKLDAWMIEHNYEFAAPSPERRLSR